MHAGGHLVELQVVGGEGRRRCGGRGGHSLEQVGGGLGGLRGGSGRGGGVDEGAPAGDLDALR